MAYSLEVLSLYIPWINRGKDLERGDFSIMSYLQLLTLELRLLEGILKAFGVVLIASWLVS